MPPPKDLEKLKLWKLKQSTAHKDGRYLKKRWDDPVGREILLSKRAAANTDAVKKKRSLSAKQLWEDPDFRARVSHSHKEWHKIPENKTKITKALKERFKDPELLERMRLITTKRYEDPLERMKITERAVGGFWYGCVRYEERSYYCQLWTQELCDRIRAAWGYKSALSGKTSEDNRGKELDCHHVYFQKKACCEWDSDLQGYYAMINIGTKRKPDLVRYNIKGDPNKFVPLTHAEHAMMQFDKLKWIKFFEDLIESRGGKCYFTKEEMAEFNS